MIPSRKIRRPVIGYESFIITGFEKERSYVPSYNSMGGLTSVSITSDTTFYIFFSVPFDVIVRKLYVPFTSSTNAVDAIYAIYTNRDTDIMYPDKLIWQSGSMGTSFSDITGLSVPLRGGEGYWLALAADISGLGRNANHVVAANQHSTNVFGDSGSFGASMGGVVLTESVCRIMGQAPEGLTLSTGNYPAVGLTFDIQ